MAFDPARADPLGDRQLRVLGAAERAGLVRAHRPAERNRPGHLHAGGGRTCRARSRTTRPTRWRSARTARCTSRRAPTTRWARADSTWGNRPERLLSAAVLRLDPAADRHVPLDVKTAEGGSYDPYAAGAPLTIYATGVRNAFDLVWHRNGHLYAPTNGSAAGGNTPATPAPLPASCARRGYTGSGRTGADRRARRPRPTTCSTSSRAATTGTRTRCAANGCWPAATRPPARTRSRWARTRRAPGRTRTSTWPAPTTRACTPRPTARSSTAAAPSTASCWWSATRPGRTSRPSTWRRAATLSNRTTGITGLTGFSQPLDVTQDPATGNLYVTELGANRITLLKPRP